MKQTALVLSLSLAAAGCGNWSNDDVEFYAALPDKQQLMAKLPGATASELVGEGTRRDPLGEDSKLYADTKKASSDFNGLLDGMLGHLDTIRKYPATTRTKTQRIWGPWEDKDNNPGFEVRVVMDKLPTGNFTFAIQFRPKGGEFFSVVEGTFAPTPELKKGSGQMVIFAAVMNKNLGPQKDWENLDTIEMGYITNTNPISVAMVFKTTSGAISKLSYGYQELANGNGRMGFSAFGWTDPNISQLDVFSAWTTSGGFGVWTVVEGAATHKGATRIECWDAKFKSVFVAESWPGGKLEGDQKACVTVEGFPEK